MTLAGPSGYLRPLQGYRVGRGSLARSTLYVPGAAIPSPCQPRPEAGAACGRARVCARGRALSCDIGVCVGAPGLPEEMSWGADGASCGRIVHCVC